MGVRRRREYPGLGVIPDYLLAAALGLDPSTICHVRGDRGIPSPRPRGRPSTAEGRQPPPGIPGPGGSLRPNRMAAALTMGRLAAALTREDGTHWTASSVNYWEGHPGKRLPWNATMALLDAISWGRLPPWAGGE